MEFISFDRRLVGGGAVLLMLAGLNHFQGLSYVDLRAKDIAVHVVLGLIVYTLVPMYVFDLVYAVKMRAAGCKPAAYYKHRDPIFGVDWVLRMLRGLKACEALQIIQQCFETIGHTFVVKPFGEYVVMTDEPENIKAILSTNFEDWPLAGPRLHTVLGVLGPNSIFSANGKAWQKARAMLRPFFARDQIADLGCFDCHISNLINRIPRDGEVFDLQELLYKMTTDSSTDFL